MAYFINSKRRLEKLIVDNLTTLFGNCAEVSLTSNEIHVKINACYGQKEKRLTQEELDSGVLGGGIEAPLNGRHFKLVIEEVT